MLRDTYSQCATALSDDEVDAVTTDQPILAGYAHQSGGRLRVLNNPLSLVSDELYGVGIRKGDEKLRSFLNARLREIVDNGDWDRAHRFYLADIDMLPPVIGVTQNLPLDAQAQLGLVAGPAALPGIHERRCRDLGSAPHRPRSRASG